MVRQINPSLARLWLSDRSRQYGATAGFKLENLTEPELRVLDFLERGIPDNQMSQLHKMAGAKQEKTESLISRLAPLIVKTSSFLPLLDAGEVERQFSEIMRLYLLEHTDPAAALKKRKTSKIFISSLNRTGLVLTRALAASGIGTVFSADQKSVSDKDTLELGYPKTELGIQRARAARRIVLGTNVELHSRVSETYARADLAILIGTDVIHPSRYAPWMARDIPHLSVVFDEVGVTVSHLVLPGITPCLACLELERLKSDQHWATTATQLAQLDRDLADSALILFGASMALTLSLNLIDGFGQLDNLLASKLLRTSELKQLAVQSASCGCQLAE
jgi:hypothetical protein